MSKQVVIRCNKKGCDCKVNGKDSFFCPKHELQRYHPIFHKTWGSDELTKSGFQIELPEFDDLTEAA